MKTPVQVAIGDYNGSSNQQQNLIGVYIDGVTSGYRDIWYGNDSIANLYATTIR